MGSAPSISRLPGGILAKLSSGIIASFAVLVLASSAQAVEQPSSPADTKPTAAALEKNRAEARAFRAYLAERGKNGDDNALVDLATITEQGDSAAPADRAAALDLYEKAADHKDQIGREKICIAYLLGEGRAQNIAKASTYCDPLDEHDPVGMFWAGYAFQHGIGGDADESAALQVYGKAVELGSGDAADALGQIAMKKNTPAVAGGWYRRGVFLGSADAMDHLAAMLENGAIGDGDSQEVAWLYSHAATLGNSHAEAWIASHPSLKEIPYIAWWPKSPKGVVFTRYYIDKGAQVSETFDYSRFVKLLTANIPDSAEGFPYALAYANLDCYIGRDHFVRGCTTREFPIRMGFGLTLEAFFTGKVSVSAVDGEGKDTAQKRVLWDVNWDLKGY